LELSGRFFEWLLADWAGYGNNPAELFASLRGVKSIDLTEEFATAMQKAGASEELVEKFHRMKTLQMAVAT